MLLQRITKPLAWTQLIVSVVIIATVIYGQLKLHDTWAANSPFLESTRASLQHAKQSLNEASHSLASIKSDLPGYADGIKSTNAVVMRLPPLMENLSERMGFSVPVSVEMQGVKPILIMAKPMEPIASGVRNLATDIRQVGSTLQNTGKSIQTMPAVLSEVIETMASSQAAITQFEPMIGQIEILVNWGSLIALLIAIWCLMNSLSTLALAHSKATSLNHSGVTQ